MTVTNVYIYDLQFHEHDNIDTLRNLKKSHRSKENLLYKLSTSAWRFVRAYLRFANNKVERVTTFEILKERTRVRELVE